MIEKYTVFKTNKLNKFLESFKKMSEYSGGRPLEIRTIQTLFNTFIKENGNEITKQIKPVDPSTIETLVKKVTCAKDFHFQLGEHDR